MHQPPEDPPAANGTGETALTFGVVAFLVSFIPVVGDFVAAPAALLAIVLGLIGVGRVEKGQATNAGKAVAGVVLGAVAVAILVVTLIASVAPAHQG